MKIRFTARALPLALAAILAPSAHADENLLGYVSGAETLPRGASEAYVWLSGGLWLAFHYFVRTEGEFGPAPHPLEAWWLRLHGLIAMAALVLAGSLAPNHIRLAWNRRRNHHSGLPMLALTVWLAATGYALYYFSSDDNAAWLPLLHWFAGLALPLLLGLHIRLGRRRALPAIAQPQHPQRLHVAAASYNPPARTKASP